MRTPKMVLFDYGQTLIAEQNFDGIRGTEAVLQYATRNKYHLSAEQVQVKANEINREFGRFDPEKRHLFQIEIPNTMFTPYLYESQGIEIALSNSEIDTVFWNAAAPGMPTEGIKDFLVYLKNKGIRTGVISNICYAPSVVAERININAILIEDGLDQKERKAIFRIRPQLHSTLKIKSCIFKRLIYCQSNDLTQGKL